MARLLVSDGTVAKEVITNFKIAFSGLVLPIARSLCAQGGVAYQYWPKASNSNDPNILWDKHAFTAAKYETLINQPAISSITFITDGTYVYTADTSVSVQNSIFGDWLGITVTGAGQYLIKADLVSGTFGGATLGVWIDAFTPPSYTLTKAITGSEVGVLDITVAAGSVTPDADTDVTKRVTFNSHVVDEATKVSWSNIPEWDIESLTFSVPAVCDFTFNPNGTAQADGSTSGSLFANWHEDASIVPDPENFTVQVDLISGDAPTGPALATPHTLDVVREWLLTAANNDDDFSNEVDVTVGDGVAFTTKRINMHSFRGAEPSTNTWNTDPWLMSATGFEVASVVSEVRINPDGTAEGYWTGSPSSPAITNHWNSNAPSATDAENYEAMLIVTAGSQPDAGTPAIGVWHSLSPSLISWTLTLVTTGGPIPDTANAEWEVRIRRVGQPSVNKPVSVFSIIEYQDGP